MMETQVYNEERERKYVINRNEGGRFEEIRRRRRYRELFMVDLSRM
jgi:hypothetical protein